MLYRRRRSKFSELVPNPFAKLSCNKICSNQTLPCGQYCLNDSIQLYIFSTSRLIIFCFFVTLIVFIIMIMDQTCKLFQHFAVNVCVWNNKSTIDPDLLVSGLLLLFSSIIIKQTLICCLLYTSPSPRDLSTSRMPSSA